MPITSFLRDALLEHVLRATAYASPATVYLALHTGDPGDAGTANEVSGVAYVRKAVSFDAVTDDGSLASTTNAVVSFPTALGNWGTVTHWSIWDAASGGNSLFYGELATSQVVLAVDEVTMPAGQVTVRLGNSG